MALTCHHRYFCFYSLWHVRTLLILQQPFRKTHNSVVLIELCSYLVRRTPDCTLCDGIRPKMGVYRAWTRDVFYRAGKTRPINRRYDYGMGYGFSKWSNPIMIVPLAGFSFSEYLLLIFHLK